MLQIRDVRIGADCDTMSARFGYGNHSSNGGAPREPVSQLTGTDGRARPSAEPPARSPSTEKRVLRNDALRQNRRTPRRLGTIEATGWCCCKIIAQLRCEPYLDGCLCTRSG